MPESRTISLMGTIKSDGTLELEQMPGLVPGKVRVTLQSLTEPLPAKLSLLEFLQAIPNRLHSQVHDRRTKDEIDAAIHSLRDEWEERLAELELSRQNLPLSGKASDASLS